MNHLAYVVAEESPYGHPEEGLDLAVTPGYQLFFSCFMGDIDFLVDGEDFRTRFGWVSTLSFALAMLRHLQELPETGQSRVEFQEDEEWILLEEKAGDVRISCSYADGRAVIRYPDLRFLAREALVSLLDELYGKHPRLAVNPSLNKALLKIGELGRFRRFENPE